MPQEEPKFPFSYAAPIIKLLWNNQKTLRNDLEKHLRAVVFVSNPNGMVLLSLAHTNGLAIDE